MISKVIHGEGKPRIVIPSLELFSGSIISITGLFNIELSGTFVFDSSVMNKMAYTYNANNEVTKGKVISYSNELRLFIVDKWDNLPPVVGKKVSIHDIVIDLPYCQSGGLNESFSIDAGPIKKMWNTGRKRVKIKGFYYGAVLDYSKNVETVFIQSLQPLYDASRTTSFIFYPRSDNPAIYYDCEIDPESKLEFAQLVRHQGMKNIQLRIMGLDRIQKPDLLSNLSTVLGVENIIMNDSLKTN
jgi:hypothetical protein